VLRAKASARILIAGQAPGTRVHQSGVPFTDPSGDRLRDWMGIDSDTFYDDTRVAIVPMGFCFPGLDAKGGDRPPRKECAPAWRTALMAHLDQVELTLLVGSYAQAWHLGVGRKASVSETVRSFREYAPRFVPMPHPSWRNNAWLGKNPWFAEELLPHLRQRISAILKS
jgi:uracil-DNA glycosylase